MVRRLLLQVITASLVISFCLILNVAIASESVEENNSIVPVSDDEIRFQGVEWGSSPAVFDSKISEIGIDIKTCRVTKDHECAF